MTGIGSLIFRDEEKIVSEAPDPQAMYAETSILYKGMLWNLWYQESMLLCIQIL